MVFTISDCVPSYTSRYSSHSFNGVPPKSKSTGSYSFLVSNFYVCLESLYPKYDSLCSACHAEHNLEHCSGLTIVPSVSSVGQFPQHYWQLILNME